MDELQSEDVQLRLNAIHSIPTIALALGCERARTELVPFLQDSIDDEDEVLVALAQELGRGFEKYIGGSEYAHILLPPLANLGVVDETLVRDEAAASIIKVVDVLSQEQVEDFHIPLLKKLGQGEWFTSRVSSAAIYPAAYTKVSPAIQDDLRKGYTALASDDTPMVRRAVAKSLSSFLGKLSNAHMMTDGLSIYRRLQSDDQDSVRLLTVDSLVVLAKQLGPPEIKEHLLHHIRHTTGDRSWRVRHMAATHFNQLAEAVGVSLAREEMLGQYVQLLKDNEAEVRTAASEKIADFAKFLDKEVILARILPCIRDLSQDSSQHVRAALAVKINELAPLLGKEPTIEHVLPLILHLLKDDFPDVRLNIISKLEILDAVTGIEMLSDSLLPAITGLAEDKSWRVRQAIIEYMPLLAKQLGRSFFDEQFGTLCMSWLGDRVFSIREAATVNLKRLTEVFGVEWARITIIPKVVGMINHTSYLSRMTTVQAITIIAPSLNLEIIRGDIIGPLLLLFEDNVPNIRFNVAKAFEVLVISFGDSPDGREFVQKRITPALEHMKNDPDADVRFYAARVIPV
ncbi:armadillo-type protein [Infundibulicybe gibba]|nr:armadillo-type protein [Infundibulicybe gibba]